MADSVGDASTSQGLSGGEQPASTLATSVADASTAREDPGGAERPASTAVTSETYKRCIDTLEAIHLLATDELELHSKRVRAVSNLRELQLLQFGQIKAKAEELLLQLQTMSDARLDAIAAIVEAYLPSDVGDTERELLQRLTSLEPPPGPSSEAADYEHPMRAIGRDTALDSALWSTRPTFFGKVSHIPYYARSQDVQRATFCLSHSWRDYGERKVKLLRELALPDTATFWIDKCCIDQSSPATTAAGVARFPQFMASCDYMILFLSPSYLRRFWCVYELAFWCHRNRGSKLGLNLIVLDLDASNAEPTEQALSWLREFRCREARCFKPADRAVILASVREKFGSEEVFDEFVRTQLLQILTVAMAPRAHPELLKPPMSISPAESLRSSRGVPWETETRLDGEASILLGRLKHPHVAVSAHANWALQKLLATEASCKGSDGRLALVAIAQMLLHANSAVRHYADRLLTPMLSIEAAQLGVWATHFGAGAGQALLDLVTIAALLEKHNRVLRREGDALRADLLEQSSQHLQLIAAGLLQTLSPDQLERLLRSRLAEEALTHAVKRTLTLFIGQPGIQFALRQRWIGLHSGWEQIQPTWAKFAGRQQWGGKMLAYSRFMLALTFVIGLTLVFVLPTRLSQLEPFTSELHVAGILAAFLPQLLSPTIRRFIRLDSCLDYLIWRRFKSALPVSQQPCLKRALRHLLPLGDHSDKAALLIFSVSFFPVLGLVMATSILAPVLLISACPPLERHVTRENIGHIFWPVHMLGVPRTKFYLAVGSRVTLSLLLVALPIESVALIAPVLLTWSCAAVIDELHELRRDPTAWATDRLNILESLGLLATVMGASLAYASVDEQWSRMVLGISVIFSLMAQMLRLLTTQPSIGPLVLMFLRMFEQDLMRWIMLVAAVVVPFAASLLVVFRDTSAAAGLDEGCLDGEYLGRNYLANVWILIKAVIGGGDAHVDCLEYSFSPWFGPAVMELYLLLTIVLLLNLLIAQMSKTFDVVYENLALNYQYLFARLVLTYENQPSVVPMPLSLLRLPLRLIEQLATSARGRSVIDDSSSLRPSSPAAPKPGTDSAPPSETASGAEPLPSAEPLPRPLQKSGSLWASGLVLAKPAPPKPSILEQDVAPASDPAWRQANPEAAVVGRLEQFVADGECVQVQEDRWRAKFGNAMSDLKRRIAVIERHEQAVQASLREMQASQHASMEAIKEALARLESRPLSA